MTPANNYTATATIENGPVGFLFGKKRRRGLKTGQTLIVYADVDSAEELKRSQNDWNVTLLCDQAPNCTDEAEGRVFGLEFFFVKNHDDYTPSDSTGNDVEFSGTPFMIRGLDADTESSPSNTEERACVYNRYHIGIRTVGAVERGAGIHKVKGKARIALHTLMRGEFHKSKMENGTPVNVSYTVSLIPGLSVALSDNGKKNVAAVVWNIGYELPRTEWRELGDWEKTSKETQFDVPFYMAKKAFSWEELDGSTVLDRSDVYEIGVPQKNRLTIGISAASATTLPLKYAYSTNVGDYYWGVSLKNAEFIGPSKSSTSVNLEIVSDNGFEILP